MIDTQVKLGSYKDLKFKTLLGVNPMYYKSQSTQESLGDMPLMTAEIGAHDFTDLRDEDNLKKGLRTHELTDDELRAILKE